MNPQEVNKYLARWLMGWHLSENEFEWLDKDDKRTGYTRDYEGYTDEAWDPYHNISQALGDGGEGTVVGEMRGKGWISFKLEYTHELTHYDPPLPAYWAVQFWNFSTPGKWATADTPSAATSLAAVAALQVRDGKWG